jgi:murein DD-endopeptidase MepM/ murein hydrolase activator NlpD
VLLDVVDTACGIAPVTEDLGAFIRARVTLEAELEQDKRRRVLLPNLVAQRIDQTIRFVDMRVQELRPVMPAGNLLPAGSLRDGPLFIRQPVARMNVTSPYGVRKDPFTGARRFHAGIDIGVAHGTPVNAAAEGVVIFAGWQGGFGRHIVLDHGDGIRTHYSHLAHIYVEPGEMVNAGHVVGLVGATGRSTGPHLHFAITNGKGQFLDPSNMLNVPLHAGLSPAKDDDPTGPTRLAARP